MSGRLTIVVDTREQAPYTFEGVEGVDVVRVARAPLSTGDYMIPCGRGVVTRKSVADLYGTITAAERRSRFERELERMALLPRAMVVIDGLPTDQPPGHDTPTHLTIVRNRIAGYRARWPGVHWVWAGGRRAAEVLVVAFLREAQALADRSRAAETDETEAE